MERIWQWTWDRYGARYSWVICAVDFAVVLPSYFVVSFVVVAFENSDRYVEAAAVTVVVVLAQCYLFLSAGRRRLGLTEQWAAGHEVDRAKALEATYTWARGAVARGVVGGAISIALLLVVVGAIAGASGSRLVQYGILGAASELATC